jgi:hypothetical protein
MRTFLDFLLPNRAFQHRVQTLDRETRMKYWAIRIALTFLGVLAIYFLGIFFGIQQHPLLH